MPSRNDLDQSFEYILLCPQQENRLSSPFGTCHQSLEEINASHALGQRVSKQPTRPDDRHPIRKYEVGSHDGFPEQAIAAHVNEFCRIDDSESQRLHPVDRCLAVADYFVACSGVDADSEDVAHGQLRRGRALLRGVRCQDSLNHA